MPQGPSRPSGREYTGGGKAVASLNTKHDYGGENTRGDECTHDGSSDSSTPRPNHPTGLSTLNSQREQPPKRHVGKYEFRPMLGQGCLCSGIRLLANLQKEAQYGGEEMVAPKCHTNVKNGGAEWIESRRNPVEVVCVDNAMIAGGRRRSTANVVRNLIDNIVIS